MHTNACKGGGGSEHDQKYAFVRRFIKNTTISGIFKGLVINYGRGGYKMGKLRVRNFLRLKTG